MNKDQLAKSKGSRIRLRPIAKRFEDNRELPPIDDDWIIEFVDKNKGVNIFNVRTNHTTALGFDHIREFISDPNRDRDELKHGFLKLKVQISLCGNTVKIEPL